MFPKLLLALPLLLLASCGGGSGGSGGSDGDQTVTVAPDGGGSTSEKCINTHSSTGEGCLSKSQFDASVRTKTSQLRTNITSGVQGENDNWVRDNVNAYKAYANLFLIKGGGEAALPGKGVRLGILDSGIHRNHPDFTNARSQGIVVENRGAGAENEPTFSPSHGTSVASSAVGYRSGIAWGATTTMFSAKNPNPRTTFVPLTASYYREIFENDGKGLDILNLSLGPDQAIHEVADETELRRLLSSGTNGDRINAWAQPGVSDKTILVWAAGNEGKNSPHLNAGAMYFAPELRGHSIAVVATDRRW